MKFYYTTLILVLLHLTSCCLANSCWFLANNITGNLKFGINEHFKVVLSDDEKMTGVITFDLHRRNYYSDKQGIAFYNKYNPDDGITKSPLMVFMKEDTYDILGSIDGAISYPFGKIDYVK